MIISWVESILSFYSRQSHQKRISFDIKDQELDELLSTSYREMDMINITPKRVSYTAEVTINY
jgi:hypothetical protein